jgi:hypothetical protein
MSLLNTVTGPIRILDVGGTPVFWKTMGLRPQADLELVLLNLHARDVGPSNVECVSGDATRLPFADNAFDVVFSNSVIEHVGSLDDQRRMADEIRRVGRRYFVQTPNRFFPIEPHFFFPLFQFLPLSARVWLLMNLKLGRSRRARLDKETAIARAREIRLLTKGELRNIFPEARLYNERICGWVKSFVVYYGWEVG